MDTAKLVDFSFNPWASRRRKVTDDEGVGTLLATTRTGTGRGMPGPITVPAHLNDDVRECMQCGEAVQGKAEVVDGVHVMRLIFHSALWTDMQGNWFDYETLEPVDMYGDPLKKAA